MYFEKTYENSREKFLELSHKIQEKYPQTQIESVLMPPQNTENLFTDICYIPNQKSDTLIWMISGTHGIEAYTGSAVQQMIMEEFILSQQNLSASYLFVHSLNPYGQKNYRRVNENNVDLNRNFVLDDKVFELKNPDYNKAYARFNDFLNLPKKYQKKNFEKTRFLLKSFGKIFKEGIKTFRQAVLQGQYEFEKGIFFGGKSHQAQKQLIDELIKEYFPQYQRIILIDIHTGYGMNGQLHLIGMDEYDRPEILKDLQKLYPDHPIEQADKDKGDFYKITGSLFDYIYENSKKYSIKLLPIAWEFGTNDNIKTLKSLESLQIMMGENQGFHYGYQNDTSKKYMLDKYRNLFYPDSSIWRNRVLRLSRKTLDTLLQNI